jgi:hypothetical protein
MFFRRAKSHHWKNAKIMPSVDRHWKNPVDRDSNIRALVIETPVVTLVGGLGLPCRCPWESSSTRT